jgi:hypothetical protein
MNTKPIRIILVSEDPFSSATLTLLLAKDWRTQVILSSRSFTDLLKNEHKIPAADILVADLQENITAFKEETLFYGSHVCSKAKKVLLLSGQVRKLPKDALSIWDGGILIKGEIGFCFAWALDYIRKGFWVMTPSVDVFFTQHTIRLPENRIVLSNQNFLLPLSKRQREAVILNIILGLDHQTLSDAMGITKGSSYGLISSIYDKLEISKLLIGENNIHDYIPPQTDIEVAVDRIRSTFIAQGSTEISQKTGLVFHILTCPQHRCV